MQKDLIYINIGTKGLVDASGKAIRSTSSYPTIERGQWQVLCINFVQGTEDDLGVVTVTPVDISGSSYLFVADNNFDDDDNLMLKSYQSTLPFDQTNPESNRINIAGDWIDGSTADLTLGQMSIRIYSDTAKFVEALGSRQQLTSGLYASVKQYIPGLSAPSSVAWFPFVAKNTVRDWGDAQEVPPTGESLVPFIDAYLKQPTEYQFSVDGENWHLGQNDDDRYYRQRVANIGVDWGASIKMLYGTKGDPGTAATITVGNVSAGDAGSAPAITNTGTPTDAVFDFIIPKGDQGIQGIQGEKGDKGETGPQGPVGPMIDFMAPSVITQQVPSDIPANVKVDITGTSEQKKFEFAFQIPQGERGEAFTIDKVDILENLSLYDSELSGFSLLAADTGDVYVKMSDEPGDWSDPIPFQGPAGKDGEDGQDGYTPVRGTDYWTEEDIATIKTYVDEAIINGEW